MTEVARQKVRHIVVEKVDRLTRSGLKESVMIDDWLEIDDARHLHCVKDGIDLHKFARSGEKLNWGMRVVLAKNYTDNLREEVRKATDTMLRKGIWPSKTPNGYIRDKTHPHSPIQPDPIRAPLIQKIFSLYDSGDWSIRRLEAHLFEEGYRTKQGRRLCVSQIHAMLHDPFYTGKMLFEGHLWQGIHPPIVSVEMFDRVQHRLLGLGYKGGNGAVTFQHHAHVYRGLAYCATCGKAMTWEVHKRRTYGYCKGYKTCGERVSIREDILEREILSHLETFRLTSPRLAEWLRKALHDSHEDEQTRHESSKAEMQQLLTKVEVRLGRLLDMRIDDQISEEDFDYKRKEIGKEKDILIERIAHVSGSQDNYLDSINTLISLTQDVAQRFLIVSPEKKRVIAQHIFDKFIVSSSGVTIEYTEMFRYLSAVIQEVKSSKISVLAKKSKEDFEQVKIGSDKQKKGVLDPYCSSWWAIQNDFRTLFTNSLMWNNLFSSLKSKSLYDFDLIAESLSETS
jgi:site-specific DNA recombinase